MSGARDSAFIVLVILLSMAAPVTRASASASRSSTGSLDSVPADSSSVACAAGTIDLGLLPGFSGGEPVVIRLCGLPNLRTQIKDSESNQTNGRYYVPGANGHAMVNARVSKQALAMVAAAEAAGVTLVATSSFRRPEHQKALYDCFRARGFGCSPAEPPGYSSHQAGFAIDFVVAQPGSGCSATVTQSDPRWRWLHDHAGEFGFHQLRTENWHWDTSTPPALTC